jgi:hypothetical protein
MSLQENLNVATRVAGEVRMKVPNSSNYSWTSSPVQSTGGVAPQSYGAQIWSAFSSLITGEAPTTGINEVSGSAVGGLRSDLNREMPGDRAEWIKSFEHIKQACYMAKCGNCGELAAIACLLLIGERLKMASPSPIEYVQIWDNVTNNPALPHLVAVIGRSPNQLVGGTMPVGLPNQWHADAVICDPWDRAIYEAHNYNNFWGGLRDASSRPQALTCKLLCQL